jgi:hypothetical protein
VASSAHTDAAVAAELELTAGTACLKSFDTFFVAQSLLNSWIA